MFELDKPPATSPPVTDKWSHNGDTVTSEKWLGTVDDFALPMRVHNIEVLRLAPNATSFFKPTDDQITAFQILKKSDASVLFNADTLNKRIGINNAAPDYDFDVTGNIRATGAIFSTGNYVGGLYLQGEYVTTRAGIAEHLRLTTIYKTHHVYSDSSFGLSSDDTTVDENYDMFFTPYNLTSNANRKIGVTRGTTANVAGYDLYVKAGGASGTGAVVSATRSGSTGSGYVNGDLVLINGGGNNAYIRVVSTLLFIFVTVQGSGYTAGTYTTTAITGVGVGLEVVITVLGSTTDKVGGNLVLQSGIGVGTGSSYISFWVSPAAASGNTDNGLVEIARVTSSGLIPQQAGLNLGSNSLPWKHVFAYGADENNSRCFQSYMTPLTGVKTYPRNAQYTLTCEAGSTVNNPVSAELRMDLSGANTKANSILTDYYIYATSVIGSVIPYEMQVTLLETGANVSTFKAFSATEFNVAGHITDYYAVYAGMPTVTGAGSITNKYGVYIPALGTATTNLYAIYSVDGKSYLGGSLGIGIVPTAYLHLKAQTTLAGSAPLKLNTGVAVCMAAIEDGAFEYYNSHLYFSIGAARYQLDQQIIGTGWVLGGNVLGAAAYLGSTTAKEVQFGANSQVQLEFQTTNQIKYLATQKWYPSANGTLSMAWYANNQTTLVCGIDTTNTLFKMANNVWMAGIDFAGTGWVNWFKTNPLDGIDCGGTLNISGYIETALNPGAITWFDIPVSAAAAAGTEESATIRIGSTNLFKFYGESDGAGSVQNLRGYCYGDLYFGTVAKGIVLKQGANGKCGTFVANGAAPVTVSNTSIAITDTIMFSLNAVGGTVGAIPAIQTITAATGFTVACTAGDTSTYNYVIISNVA
jgi:hypothetical protein